MNIRPAEQADCPSIAHIQITSYRTAYQGLVPNDYLAQFSQEEQTQDWRDLLATSPGASLLVAAEDGQIAGYALSHPGPCLDGAYACELVAVHVLPEFRHQGIGRKLFAGAAEKMQQGGANSLLLWTIAGNPVRGWYAQLGGIEAGEQHHDLDGFDLVEVAYGWPEIGTLVNCLTRE